MKKRTVIRIISCFSAALVVAGGLYIRENGRVREYQLQLQNEYSSALSELDAGLNNIALILEKTVYVTAASSLASCAAKLYSEAQIAKTALSRLPSGEGTLDTVYRFLSQVGNYALSVSKGMIKGNSVTDEQRRSLVSLRDTAKTVATAVGDSHITFDNSDHWAAELEGILSETIPENGLADSLTSMDEDLSDYPTLIYDGPYSDHILTKEPLMLQQASPIGREEAYQAAARMLPEFKNELKYEDDEQGKIEAYRFSCDAAAISVSKKGGNVVYMRKLRVVGDNTFSYEQALARAKKFMADNGIEGMIDTYYFTDEGICVINFAYLDGQTICYTDLIKVGVALDTGEIMFYEAAGYITNHTDRAFEIPYYTADEAVQTLDPDLVVEETAVALVPTDGGGEVRCYEFLCRAADEREILIYVNMYTLEDEQIFILLKSDGGILVK